MLLRGITSSVRAVGGTLRVVGAADAPAPGIAFLAPFDGWYAAEEAATETEIKAAYGTAPVGAAGQQRHIGFAVDGLEGESPTVRISRTPAWNGPTVDARHRLCYGYDNDGDAWFQFPTRVSGDADVDFSGVTFGRGPVYFHTMPWYSCTRYEADIDRWVTHPLARPTPRADALCRIGTLDARTGPDGQALPEMTLRAFRIGNGPRKCAMTGNSHTDEAAGIYGLVAAIDFLLSDDPKAVSLREEWTFHCYPNLNPQSLFGGYTRIDPQSGQDCNRIWGTNTVSQIRTIYEALWDAELPGLDALIDWHHSPFNVGGRDIWYQEGPGFTATAPFLAALQEYGPTNSTGSTGTVTIGSWMARYGGRLSVYPEHRHDRVFGPSEWRAFGVDILRALDDVTESAFPLPDPATETVTPGDGFVTIESVPAAEPLLVTAGRGLVTVSYEAEAEIPIPEPEVQTSALFRFNGAAAGGVDIAGLPEGWLDGSFLPGISYTQKSGGFLKVAVPSGLTAGRRLFHREGLSVADPDVLVRFRYVSGGSNTFVGSLLGNLTIRVPGAEFVANRAELLNSGGSNLRRSAYNPDALSNSTSGSAGFSASLNTWYHMRLTPEGGLKLWAGAPQDEPAAPQITRARDIVSSGSIGWMLFSAGAEVDVEFISYSTDGPAPFPS